MAIFPNSFYRERMVMGYYIVVNALCDWGKVFFVDESFREANKIIVEN